MPKNRNRTQNDFDVNSGWEDTVPQTGGGFPVGRGYEAQITDVVIEEQDYGKQVVWSLLGVSTEIEGMKARKISFLTSDGNRAWFRGEMEAIDLEWPSSFAGLGAALDGAQDALIRIDVAQGKDKDGKANEYTNIRFRERLAGFGEPAAPSEEAASGEPTAKEIFAMSEEELVALNDEWNLNLDEAKYNTWDAYAKALVKEGGFTD